MSRLSKRDIVGNVIVGIYRSAYTVEADGFGGCEAYISLQNGATLVLESLERSELLPPRGIDLASANIEPCGDARVAACVGDKIIDVLVSEFWPSIGLLLESDHFLFLGPIPNPDRSGAMLVAPCAQLVGEMYDFSDVRSWE